VDPIRRLLVAAALLVPLPGSAVTIDWALVGDPGNAADTASNCLNSATDCGSVGYSYYVSKDDVTNAQYAEFLNAKAAADPLGLYNPSMDSDATNGGITQSGTSGSYTYAVKAGFENKPVNYVSFWDSVRFANWLNNGQGSGDTETGAYTITADGITNNTITRNLGAMTFLPSENEWYKAAYFNGTTYFVYPAGSNTPTVCAAPGATPNTANCFPSGPGMVTDVGAYTGSASPYGTFDQGGNVYQWNEQIMGVFRGRRGGGWGSLAMFLAASSPLDVAPSLESNDIGFRVASLVPESDAGLSGLVVMTALFGLAASRRRRLR
jgi:formylglycine-generating enzyme